MPWCFAILHHIINTILDKFVLLLLEVVHFFVPTKDARTASFIFQGIK